MFTTRCSFRVSSVLNPWLLLIPLRWSNCLRIRNMTFKTAIVVAFVFVFLAGGSRVWSAETINRKREKNLSGEVSSVTKTEVQVKVKTPKEDTIKVPANDIASIERSGETPQCKVARSHANGGRFQKAIDGYQKALQSNKASNASLKTHLEFAIARAA